MICAEEAVARLCDPAAEVSAHYVIAENGRIWRLVPETERAWHAGLSFWAGERDLNSRSVGIELANPGHGCGHAPFPLPQMRALEALLGEILGRWSIPPERVLAHSDIAPLRKQDPGPRFDWRGLARRGLSVWPDSADSRADQAEGRPLEDFSAFLAAARRFGYEAGPGSGVESGVELGGDGRNAPDLGGHGRTPAAEAILVAARLRFRPEALGSPLDSRDLAILEEAAARWPAPAGLLTGSS